MDPTEFSRAKHNLADLTKSAAVIRKLELQTMKAELDRERSKRQSGKKSGGSDSDPDLSSASQETAQARTPAVQQTVPDVDVETKIAFIKSVREAQEALRRLQEAPCASEPDADIPPPTSSESPSPMSRPFPASLAKFQETGKISP